MKFTLLLPTLIVAAAVALPAGPPEPQSAARPRILGVAHIALYVGDLAKARAFYEDFLGYQEPFTLPKDDGSVRMAFVKINDRQYLELSTDPAPTADRLAHISLYTDDAVRMRDYLASRGVPVPAQVGTGRIGNRNFNIKDPDGHTVEIVEYRPDGWSAKDDGKHLAAARISTRMTHLGILVGSLDAAQKFYGDILGFKEFWRGSAAGSTTLSWVNMRVPDGEDYLEFMLYSDLPEPGRRGTAHHICLEVSDMQQAVGALESRPARKAYTRPIEMRTGINRRRQVNLYDPDGTRTELMEAHTVDGKPAPASTLPPPR
jgi:catechol 2,3-dioxygenase-like lactoylglutathione lyase family enzyme